MEDEYMKEYLKTHPPTWSNLYQPFPDEYYQLCKYSNDIDKRNLYETWKKYQKN